MIGIARRRTPLLTGGEGEYEYVDLGLPSGLLWAKCNLGAVNEYDYGDYYQWGAINPGDNYWNGTTVLDSAHDAVAQKIGNGWRMPTSAELSELINNTNKEWVNDYNGTGINGKKFINRTDSTKYIFVPAAGFYYFGNYYNLNSEIYMFSSTPYDEIHAYIMYGSQYDHSIGENYYKDYARSVRGVRV